SDQKAKRSKSKAIKKQSDQKAKRSKNEAIKKQSDQKAKQRKYYYKRNRLPRRYASRNDVSNMSKI
ncbi:hypothetical protein, partial [uncultured Kordia sp.]|uniref:hypothetical protein n=1 Tax=uncultured Kordia sp. TaxID=507699 RepID=UPI0026159262